MPKTVRANPRKSSKFDPFAVLTIPQAVDHLTSNPYETRPVPDGILTYQLIPVPKGVAVERDVMVAMPDGVKLACNIYRPDRSGKFPIILGMTPYGKDKIPPVYNQDGSFLPDSYPNYVQRLYKGGYGLGHQKISLLTAFEFADPAFWAPNGYAVIIADQRGGFNSGGKLPSPSEQGDDLYYLIEWAAARKWSNGNVGMVGVSALAMNQYVVASRQPSPPHLKALIPWEGQSDRYRDAAFWGGIPETNFTKRPLKEAIQKLPPEKFPDKAAQIWAAGIDPVANQVMMKDNAKLERITTPALICATWSDKGLHTRGTFELFRRISSKDKWLYTHGCAKWDRFYGEEGLAYQKAFFDHYLKGAENGWKATPRVRLEVRETREEYTVRFENEFPLARTRYKKLYLDAHAGSLIAKAGKVGKVVYNSTQGGSASFGFTFDRDTELTGYMKVKLWVSAEDADDMDLFVTLKKFAGPCDSSSPICRSLDAAMGQARIAKGNEIQFWGHDGFPADAVARGQMRVSQRELDRTLSTSWQPVQKFEGEKKLKPGQIVPIEIALPPSSTLFRKGESLRLFIQGHCPVNQPVVFYEWLINEGRHAIYTGGEYVSYLQIPVIR